MIAKKKIQLKLGFEFSARFFPTVKCQVLSKSPLSAMHVRESLCSPKVQFKTPKLTKMLF